MTVPLLEETYVQREQIISSNIFGIDLLTAIAKKANHCYRFYVVELTLGGRNDETDRLLVQGQWNQGGRIKSGADNRFKSYFRGA
jgi:hypothetical protein